MEDIQVLVIDDDASVRWVFEEMLQMGDFSYRMAASGPEALELVKKNDFKVAIIDVKLGAMSGLEVANRIHSLNQGTKIVFISGYTESLAGNSDALPIAGIIEKPFQIDDLLARINGWLLV